MSPAVFFQSYPLYLRGETLSLGLSARRLNEKFLGHALIFIFVIDLIAFPFSFVLCLCSATAPHQRYLGKRTFDVLNMLFICLFLCHTLYDCHLHAACVRLTVSALVDYYVIFFSCSEEKSDEVTNLLGEVRSVLFLLACLVKLDTFLKLYCVW